MKAVLRELPTFREFQIRLYNPSFTNIFSWFAAEFKRVAAAGGVVKNQYGEYLFIFRNGFWDLPKGKAEKGETIEQTALREVQEETGVYELALEEFLCDTWHCYLLKGKMLLKQTYWYRMTAPKEQNLTPQTEEGIEAIAWLSREEIQKRLPEMYSSVRDVVNLI